MVGSSVTPSDLRGEDSEEHPPHDEFGRNLPADDVERLATGPHLDSIRDQGTEGIPVIITFDDPARQPSDAGRSEWTVFDRGNQYYISSPPPESPPVSINPSRPLGDQLLEAYCGKTKEKPGFIPRGTLEQLITEDVVINTLTNALRDVMDHNQICHYARRICHGSHVPGIDNRMPTYRSVFAILVLIERPGDIVQFIENEVSDDCLPLASILRPDASNLIYLCSKHSPDEPLEFLKEWSAQHCRNFEREQWATVAPYFVTGEGGQVLYYELHEKDVLPWRWVDKNCRAGGFSLVTHVDIHPQHHNFYDTLGDGTFAVKCLTTDDSSTSGSEQTQTSRRRVDRERSDFMAEVAVLRRFSGDNAHPHLMSLLTTYKKGGHYHLLFHWAESDLLAFWRDAPSGDPLAVDNLSWMIGQCRGIADGVQSIHEYQPSQKTDKVPHAGPQSHAGARPDQVYGRHTDIKPENFLLFKKKGDPNDRGTIKLTDFGLCEFHGVITRSLIHRSKIIAITPTYRPPECDMKTGLISRSFDIWSLGCVYLEFITWYLGGWDFLKKFSESRKAPDIHGHNADQFFEILTTGDLKDNKFATGVKKEVVNWIRMLHAHEKCSEPIHVFLDLIHKSMLVVESQDIKRAPCSEIHKALENIFKMISKPSFRLVASPRQPTLEVPDPVETDLNDDARRAAVLRKTELRRHDGRTRHKSTTWPNSKHDGQNS